FSWVFFLGAKDETSGILQNFIRQIENQLNHRNGVAERMNRTLIEAARTMPANSLLPTTFWAEAVSTACYIFNRKEASPTGISEVVPDILAFRREIDAIALKHLGVVPDHNTTSTPSVNTGSGLVNTGKFDATHHADLDD
ncbi:putative ribonuclease H-like domain-containing protein, partial [Tanacetum coccineum]